MGKTQLITALFIGWLSAIPVYAASQPIDQEQADSVITLTGNDRLNCTGKLVNETLKTLYKERPYQAYQAREMIQPCADAGDAASQLALSLVYYKTDDNPLSDEEESLIWAKKAGLQGNAIAQFEYAVALDLSGSFRFKERQPVLRKAFSWYYKAALQGHPEALFQIGKAFRKYSFDSVSAYMWHVLALRRVKDNFSYSGFASNAVDHLESSGRVSKEGIAEALRLADAWEARYPRAAKSWPTESWVEGLKGPSAQLIPPPFTYDSEPDFCSRFGSLLFICPQHAERDSYDIVKELRTEAYQYLAGPPAE
ncbi:tetratricopeptide repeat protein [Motiliproteus sp. MSK22-1]|uniref:tetratricopeptide repeat protein n=1 Tax=Motiliproteus sp. MSK22-1 TaxID=1897630 RepID=UPI0009757765|nr:sel1 repeat family protein [Motiliproteus sp. MSK22-1]OMH30313.1 hypothetical protein BGP75_18170 [Motiliproteus sp. MSK22-1]